MTTPVSRRTVLKASATAISAAALASAPNIISARSQSSTSEAIEVSWAAWVPGPVDEDNLARQTIKERFNIDLKMLGFERATWQDQINTRIGGGDIPDIIYRDSPGLVKTYIEQGVLREVPYDAIKASSPLTYAAINAFTTDVWLATWDDAKNYGVPFCQPNQLRPNTDGWRKDWLDKLGIAAVPTTIDAYGETFKQMVASPPSESGSNYGLTFRGKDAIANNISPFCMAYGATPNMWMQLDDGSLQHGASTEGTRAALETLAKWYADGSIDPEFITTDAISFTQKWASGSVGYVTSNWYRLIPGGEHYDALKAVYPEAQIAMANAPTGPDGKFGYFNWGPITSSLTFSTKVDDTKLARILEMVEALEAEPELATLVRFGKEGEHWVRDPETNAIIPSGDFVNPANRGPIGSNFFAAHSAIPDVQAMAARKDEAEFYKFAEAGNVKNFIPFAQYLVGSDVTDQAESLDMTRDTWLTDFIVGAKSIDDWDDYIQEWNDAGGTVLTEATNSSFPQLEQVRADIKTAVSA